MHNVLHEQPFSSFKVTSGLRTLPHPSQTPYFDDFAADIEVNGAGLLRVL